jgi:hypothetical protein
MSSVGCDDVTQVDPNVVHRAADGSGLAITDEVHMQEPAITRRTPAW